MVKSGKKEFQQFFAELSGGCYTPRNWQSRLSIPSECENRLIRIPTGFGKTIGVLAAWLWHRVHMHSEDWPRRLVWCLPMRVLVEQTKKEVCDALQHLQLLWDEKNTHEGKIGVHLLMGGADAGRWHLYPESYAVLIGTQDMLLSRAMNRGYASPRARWPMEFGLLNQDALWVMDEVQLMDVGLATSAQLQAFRGEDREAKKTFRPCFTWWMSATLQDRWLKKSPDTEGLTEALAHNTHQIEPAARNGSLWDDVTKSAELTEFADTKKLARQVAERHTELDGGKEGPTLAVLNTVDRAIEVWKALRSNKTLQQAQTEIRLLHSRFRPYERKQWASFLNRSACKPGTNRIIVSTQVIEAGVDVSATLLFTELAPWTSLVQRFGRCARWGGTGQVVVADFGYRDDKKAAPYSASELDAARGACKKLSDVGPIHLEQFEEENKALLPELYPYEPKHLLLRHELDELFDTSPDLSGADIDISRFIRSGDERDVQVFWARIDDDDPPPSLKPTREELCNVPFLKAREWLLKQKAMAWIWDWLDQKWRVVKRRDIYPGQTMLVKSRVGGYSPESGWDPKSDDEVEPVQHEGETHFKAQPCWKHDGDGWLPSERRVRTLPPEDHADAAEDDESLSESNDWQTIASHGLQVGKKARSIADAVAPTKASLLHLAGRWHDLGKAHAAFQGSIQADDRPRRDDIAKAPDAAWPCRTGNMYRIDATDQRHGFRHELASALGLFGVLQRHEPQHPALLGPWTDWFDAMADNTAADAVQDTQTTPPQAAIGPTAIEQEILALDSDDFDLLAYLVCSHHGKVRMTWHASPADQKANAPRLRIRGIQEGDLLPPVELSDAEGKMHRLPAMALNLSPSESGLSRRTGRSWTERVICLLERMGPFTLAWLEALLRAADQRASIQVTIDRLLQEQEQENDHAETPLDRGHRTVAQSVGRRTSAASPGGDTSPRRQFHGDGGRTGGRRLDSGTTRRPHSATRYIETTNGILSYQELAPLLARYVGAAEAAIAKREFTGLPVHDLLLELHRRVCVELTPNMAGRWRLRDVRVGEHQPPPHWQVPALMRNYADDLEMRLKHLDKTIERLVETLVFAEGHLLSIHPFEDFNGRVSRLFLIELCERLNLPIVDPGASSPEETTRYFAALSAYDHRDARPMSAIWRQRFSRANLR